ncbi:MAG: hypothetical protein WBW80_14140, partial [Acidimicrobiales bacterium]
MSAIGECGEADTGPRNTKRATTTADRRPRVLGTKWFLGMGLLYELDRFVDGIHGHLSNVDDGPFPLEKPRSMSGKMVTTRCELQLTSSQTDGNY